MSATLERPVIRNTGRSKPPIKHIEARPGYSLCGKKIKKDQPGRVVEADHCVVCSSLANNRRWNR